MRKLPTGAFIAFLTAVLVTATGPAAAFEPVYTDEDNVAIEGYDTVAYFTEGRPVHGDPAYQTEWQGARWQFSSAEHRDMFEETPDKYAPRYGGFCSGAMSRGWKYQSDPEAWRIIDDKLYLSFTKPGIEEFAEESEETIPRADENWERLELVN